LQCYTGLRVSDLRRVNLDTISEDKSMILMQATKTDEAIKLPILPEAEEILSKYDYKLPFISDQKYNKAIKTTQIYTHLTVGIFEKYIKPL